MPDILCLCIETALIVQYGDCPHFPHQWQNRLDSRQVYSELYGVSGNGLQQAKNVITPGRLCAGAGGNVSSFTFPGEVVTRFSGIGIIYPNVDKTQRIGVHIVLPDRKYFGKSSSGVLNNQWHDFFAMPVIVKDRDNINEGNKLPVGRFWQDQASPWLWPPVQPMTARINQFWVLPPALDHNTRDDETSLR